MNDTTSKNLETHPTLADGAESLALRALQPWVENPFRLISWLEIMKFSAARFVAIGRSLGTLHERFEKHGTGPLGEQQVKDYQRYFSDYASDCLEIGLKQTSLAAEQAAREISESKSIESVRHHLKAFADALSNEMKSGLFLCVPGGRSEWFEKDAETILGIDALTRFNSTRREFEESARCYALERSTASVFHSMRATEIVLRALFKSGGWFPTRMANSWGQMIGVFEEQWGKKPIANAVPIWQANLHFFGELVNDLRSIKRTYRDTTMHVESNYDQTEAKLILDGVVSLVRHTAKHLDEDGNFTP